jgi:TATA-binding protein-associated factor
LKIVQLQLMSKKNPQWVSKEFLSLLLQNLLLEENHFILDATLKLWNAVFDRFKLSFDSFSFFCDSFLKCILTPLGRPLDTSQWCLVKDSILRDPMVLQDVGIVSLEQLILCRLFCLKALARIIDLNKCNWLEYFNSSWANQRILFGVLIEEVILISKDLVPMSILKRIKEGLIDVFDKPELCTCLELDSLMKPLYAQVCALVGSDVPMFAYPITSTSFNTEIAKYKIASVQGVANVEMKQKVETSISYFCSMQERHHVTLCAQWSSVLVVVKDLPPKLNPIIRSLMNSIKVTVLFI